MRSALQPESPKGRRPQLTTTRSVANPMYGGGSADLPPREASSSGADNGHGYIQDMLERAATPSGRMHTGSANGNWPAGQAALERAAARTGSAPLGYGALESGRVELQGPAAPQSRMPTAPTGASSAQVPSLYRGMAPSEVIAAMQRGGGADNGSPAASWGPQMLNRVATSSGLLLPDAASLRDVPVGLAPVQEEYAARLNPASLGSERPPSWGAAANQLVVGRPEMSNDFEIGAVAAVKSPPAPGFCARAASTIHRVTWSTRRRRACTIIMLIILALLCYLVMRLVDTLKILNASPAIQEIRVSDLCSDKFGLTLTSGLFNPSSTTVSISAMRSSLWLGNQSHPDAQQLVGYVFTPDVTITPGNQSLFVPITIDVPNSSFPVLRTVLNRWLNGQDLPIVAKIPLVVSFPPSVFLFPLQISYGLEVALSVPALGSPSEYETKHPKWKRPQSEYEPNTITDIEFLASKDALNVLLGRVGLHLWKQRDVHRNPFEVTIPPLTVDVYVDGLHAASTSTDFFHYGLNPPPEVLRSNYGLIRATASLQALDAPGVWRVINKLRSSEDFDLKIVARAQTQPDFGVYKVQGKTCRVQTAIEGVALQKHFHFYEYEEAQKSQSQSTLKLLDLLGISITDINMQAVFSAGIDADLSGFMAWQRMHGAVPRVGIVVDVANETNAVHVPIVSAGLPSGVSLNFSQPIKRNVPLEVQVQSITQLIRVVDRFALKGSDVTIFIHADPTYSIASYLLSGVIFDFSLRDLVGGGGAAGGGGGNPSPSAAAGRRELDALSGKAFSLAVSSSYYDVKVSAKATGFNSAFFGGVHLNWKPFTYRLSAQVPGSTAASPWWQLVTLSMSAYDSDAANPAITLSLAIQDDSYNSNVLIPIFDNITNHVPVPLSGAFKYGTRPEVSQPFTLYVAPDATNTSSAAAGAAALSPSASVFQLYHAEVVALYNSAITTNVAFGLDLGPLQLNVTVPPIELGIARCGGEPLFLGIAMNQIYKFTTGTGTPAVPIKFELVGFGTVLDIAERLSVNQVQSFCIVPNYNAAYSNFLSYMVTRVGLSFAAGGNSTVGNSTGGTRLAAGNSTLISGITLMSNQTHACTSVALNLTSSNVSPGAGNAVTNDLTVAWPRLDAGLQWQYKGVFRSVISVTTNSGWYGPITPYKRSAFNAPATQPPINVLVCVVADLAYNLNTSVAATRAAVQTLYDGADPMYVRIVGSLADRVTAVRSPITADFTIPGGAIDAYSRIRANSGSSQNSPANTGTDWGRLINVELWQFNYNTVVIIVKVGAGNLGFLVTVPPIQVRVAQYLSSVTEAEIVHVTASVPTFGNVDNFALPVNASIQPSPGNTWGLALTTLKNMFSAPSATLVVGPSLDWTQNLLSRVIPDFKITFAPGTSSPTASPSPAVALTGALSSTATVATLSGSALIQSKLSFGVTFGTLDVHFFDGNPATAHDIGLVQVSGGTVQNAGSGFKDLIFQLYGQAPAYLSLLTGGSDMPVGFSGTIGGRPMTSYFTLPASFLSAAAVSTPTQGQTASSTFTVKDFAVLGSDNVGMSGVLPCIIPYLCNDQANLIRNDTQLPSSGNGVTVGVTIAFQMPSFGPVTFDLHLNSEVSIDVQSNGFLIGNVVLRGPVSINSADTQKSVVLSFLPNLSQVAAFRDTLDFLMQGSDIVFTFSGTPTFNYLSNALSSVSQDVAVSNAPTPGPSDSAIAVSMDIKQLSLYSTSRNRAQFDWPIPVTYNPASGLTISLGSVNADVFYGHTQTSGVYNLDGHNVLVGELQQSIELRPELNAQTFTLRLGIQYFGDVGDPSQFAAENLISNIVFRKVTPLEAKITLTPPAAAKTMYGAASPFTLTAFITLPAVHQAGASDLVTDVNPDIAAALISNLYLSYHIPIKFSIRNILPFPILVAYFQFDLQMSDSDGVNYANCGVFTDFELGTSYVKWATSYPPRQDFHFQTCFPGSFQPCDDHIIRAFTGFDGGPIYPLRSVIIETPSEVGPFLQPGEVGPTYFDVFTSDQSTWRLQDDNNFNHQLCGAVRSGIFQVTLKADAECTEDQKDTVEQDLVCSYTFRIYIDQSPFALAGNDTCGTQMGVPSLGIGDTTGFSESGVNQLGIASSATLTTGLRQAATQSGPGPYILVKESFQITFDLSFTNLGNHGWGESASFNFLSAEPPTSTSPALPLNCGLLSCDKLFAVKGLSSRPYVSVVFNVRGCATLAIVFNGEIESTPWRISQSCGSELPGKSSPITITYNAPDKRMQIDVASRSLAFDLDLAGHLSSEHAWPAITANTGDDSTTISYANFKYKLARTDGHYTVPKGTPVLPRVNAQGSLMFQARDSAQRPRYTFRNQWQVAVVDAATNRIVIVAKSADRYTYGDRYIVDNGDGTYTFFFKISARGRYTVRVGCISDVAPYDCLAGSDTSAVNLVVGDPFAPPDDTLFPLVGKLYIRD